MPKINMMVKVEKKEVPILRRETSIRNELMKVILHHGYNKGQEDYGNKEIGLDVGKIMEVIDKDYEEGNFILPFSIRNAIALALKAKEGEIIVEVEG